MGYSWLTMSIVNISKLWGCLDGREVWGKIDTCICMAESFCYSPKTVTTLLIGHCCCSVTQLCPTLCNPVSCSMPGFPVLHQLPELSQTHVHWVSDGIQPSHLLSPASPLDLSIFKHQGLFRWVGSLHQVAKVLELQFQHLSFQWIFRVDLF